MTQTTPRRLRNLKLLISEELEEEVTIVAGLEVTITQEPFMRADAARAKKVLDSLRTKREAKNSCYSTPVTKIVEIDS